MKSTKIAHFLLLSATGLCCLFTVSCSSSDDDEYITNTTARRVGIQGYESDYHPYDLERRLEKRNDAYSRSIQRRSMRRKARDERYNQWFDMIMQ